MTLDNRASYLRYGRIKGWTISVYCLKIDRRHIFLVVCEVKALPKNYLIV